MGNRPTNRIPASLRSNAAPSNRGPAPGRILAAAAATSVGIGLMAAMAAASPAEPVVIEMQPTPVVLAPGTAGVATPSGAAPTTPASVDVPRRVIAPATPAPAPTEPAATDPPPAPRPVADSEAS